MPIRTWFVPFLAAVVVLLGAAPARATVAYADSDVFLLDTITGVDDPTDRLPAMTRLAAIQPNPFNPSTTIKFSVPKAGRAALEVFDLRGRKVASLVDGELAAGDHSLQFSGEGLPSGTYFYRLSGDGYEVTEKMQLVK